jgi:hypothetical protein
MPAQPVVRVFGSHSQGLRCYTSSRRPLTSDPSVARQRRRRRRGACMT